MSEISASIAIISAIVAVIAFFFQNWIRKDMFFKECAKSLYSTNPTEQITAAILLRNYVNKLGYSSRTKNMMVALLRTSIPATLQKVVADVFSYSDSLKGQDMQYINMLGALIKPKACVKYELTGSIIYKQWRLSMRQADCFHAIIKECSINHVDATKAVFAYSNLVGTRFNNCILSNANFVGANVEHVVFDEDCKLQGAKFAEAIGLEQAYVKFKQNKQIKKIPLILFLNSEGVFSYDLPKQEKEYCPMDSDIKVFVSKLGAMDSKQLMQYQNIIEVISGAENTELIHIEREQYPIVSQLSDVLLHINQCDGCLIFACEYMEIEKGCVHKDIVSEDRKALHNASVVSPWLHIETALANMSNIPCLIIYDKNLLRDGMFDEKIIEPDKNLFAIEYSDVLLNKNKVIQDWMNFVREYHSRRKP